MEVDPRWQELRDVSSWQLRDDLLASRGIPQQTDRVDHEMHVGKLNTWLGSHLTSTYYILLLFNNPHITRSDGNVVLKLYCIMSSCEVAFIIQS